MIKKVFTLGVLYFVQGLPYGFQDKFIPTYLRSSGLSHTKLSLMKLLLIPWLCKAAFAPILDLVWTKRFWLLCSLGSLGIVAFLGILISPEYFVAVSAWLFILNLLSAFQDVAVDGLAMKILQNREIGHGNTAQVIGYKLGALSGGGILFWIHFYYGWVGLCLSFSCLYFLSMIMFLPLYGDCGDTETHEPNSITVQDTNNGDKPDGELPKSLSQEIRKRKIETTHIESETEVVEETCEKTNNFSSVFVSVFHTKGTFSLLLFLLIYKLGERGALSTFPLFLIDQGITTKQIGFWNGLIGQSSSLLGSVYGGWMISQNWKLDHLLMLVCLARTFPIVIQWFVINIWEATSSSIIHYILFFFGITSLISLEFAGGLTTTSVFSLMMTCSLKAHPSIQSTHYSVLSSAEVAGKLIFSSFAGALIDWLGLSFVYMGFILLSLATVLIIPLLD